MIGYLDLPSGISGDIMLGCLVDAGWPAGRLRETIERLRLPAGEWGLQVYPVRKGSLRATRVEVVFEDATRRRGLSDVREILAAADLPEEVRRRAGAVFNRLAEAEAKVHGTTTDRVHFHEVGAVDAIIDVVAAVSGVHELGLARLYASPVPLGPGWTRAEHGSIPLPAPATLELLASVGAPTRPAPGPGELVTPTGAALLAELATFEQPAMSIRRVGVGAGSRDMAWPNVARLWVGEPSEAGPLVQLETNIDDMNPQWYADVSERLFAAGARDVWLCPVQMKKGRPGVLLGVLANPEKEADLCDLLLRHTTTLGVRTHALKSRHEARREIRTVATPFGEVRVKMKWIGDEPVAAMPEYEDCRALARSNDVSIQCVHDAAAASARTLLAGLRQPADD